MFFYAGNLALLGIFSDLWDGLWRIVWFDTTNTVMFWTAVGIFIFFFILLSDAGEGSHALLALGFVALAVFVGYLRMEEKLQNREALHQLRAKGFPVEQVDLEDEKAILRVGKCRQVLIARIVEDKAKLFRATWNGLEVPVSPHKARAVPERCRK